MQGERGQGRRKVSAGGNLKASLPIAPRRKLEEKKRGASGECEGAPVTPDPMCVWFSNLASRQNDWKNFQK